MAKKFVGNDTLLSALTIIKNAIAEKQDLLDEITADETQQLWNKVKGNSNGYSINLTIVNDSSDPIDGAYLELYCPDSTTLTGSCDSNGKYTFSGLAAGTYTLHVQSVGTTFNGDPEIVITDSDVDLTVDPWTGV